MRFGFSLFHNFILSFLATCVDSHSRCLHLYDALNSCHFELTLVVQICEEEKLTQTHAHQHIHMHKSHMSILAPLRFFRFPLLLFACSSPKTESHFHSIQCKNQWPIDCCPSLSSGKHSFALFSFHVRCNQSMWQVCESETTGGHA